LTSRPQGLLNLVKTIELTQGKVALVSDQDYEALKGYRWIARLSKTHEKYYAVRVIRSEGRQVKVRYMHREIMNAPRGTLVDHKDGHSLNNQRENLRYATPSQNNANARPRRNASSRYKGVSKYNRDGTWQAEISVNKDRILIGRFPTEDEAAQAYNEAAKKHYGDFAYLNPVPTAPRSN